jgi:hypothetical protein
LEVTIHKTIAQPIVKIPDCRGLALLNPYSEPPYNIQIPHRDEPMQAKLQEQLSDADAEVILGRLPERIREALIARATEIEYPVKAVIEMAIASFLNAEALGFADCQPGRGQ